MSRVLGVSAATILSYHSFENLLLRETLRGDRVIGMPERSTILAASGSTQKLNSAFGVGFHLEFRRLVEEGPGSASEHGNLRVAGNFEDLESVRCRTFHVLVAGDRCDSENLKLPAIQREQQRHPVVLRRHDEIGIEDYF